MSWFSRTKVDTITTQNGNTIQVVGAESHVYEFSSVSQMYEKCPYIRSIVDYKADCVSNAKVKLFEKSKDSKDIEIKNSPILDLLNNINPFQNSQNLLAQTLVYEMLYGVSFLRGIKGIRTGFEYSKAIWSLPPQFVNIIYNNYNSVDIYSKFMMSEIIDYFEFLQPTGIFKLYDDEILYSTQNNITFENQVSDFETLKQSVANLMYIQESRGVITRNRGAVGMLSQSSSNKDIAGSIPLKDKQKINLLNDYKKLYGLRPGQSSVIIPDVAMTWQPMILPIKDLLLDESALHEFNLCCDLLNVPRGVFDDKTAYANQLEVKKKMYQDSVIPFSDSKAAALTKKFNLTNQYIQFDYSHLECFKDNEEQKATTDKTNADRILSLYDRGLISKGECLEMQGLEVKDKSFYKIYVNETIAV